jgi:hypothetical protein
VTGETTFGCTTTGGVTSGWHYQEMGWWNTWNFFVTGYWTQYTISDISVPNDSTTSFGFFIQLVDTSFICVDDVSLHPKGFVKVLNNPNYGLINTKTVLNNSRQIVFANPTDYVCKVFSMNGKLQNSYKGFGKSIDLSKAMLNSGRYIVKGSSREGSFTFPINGR